MFDKELFPLGSANQLDDAHGLLDRERDTLPFPPESPEPPSLDAELMACSFHLSRRRTEVLGEHVGVDARRQPVIHNFFWVPGKVPSLNDLLDAKSAKQPLMRSLIMRQLPSKGKGRGARFDLYNEIKQDWKHRTIRAVGYPFVRVPRAHFSYLVIENTTRRDPSNICSAAIKFIEDGLVEAGVIANDGWEHVLGIRVAWLHRKGHEPGVFVVMTDAPMDEDDLIGHYEEHLRIHE